MRTLFHGCFSELEAAFVAELAAQRAADPLAPAHVLVPNHLLRLHLRRACARAGLPWLNVHFRTLHEFAVLLCQRAADSEAGLLPDLAIEPLLEQAIIDVLPRLAVLQPVAQKSGFRRALWRTLCELRGAGLDAAVLKQVGPRMATAHERNKFADLALIATHFEAQLKRLGLQDRPGLLARAIPAASAFNEPVFVYGFDDLTTLERQLLKNLPDAVIIAACIPYQPGQAYAWTHPLFEWMSTWSHRTLAFSEQGVPRPPVTVQFVSVPTRMSEVKALVSDLLFQASSTDGAPVPTTAVLLRAESEYIPLLRTQLAGANVRGYLHTCRTLGDVPAGRALQVWLRLLDQRYLAADVINFLASAPLREQIAGVDNTCTTAPAQWIHLVRSAGIQRGLPEWQQALTTLHEGFQLSAAAADKQQNSALAYSLRAQAAATAQLRAFIILLSAEISAWRTAKTWAAVAALVANFIQRCFRADHGLAAITSELAELVTLDRLNIPVSTGTIRSVLATALRRPLPREGHFLRDEPAVCDISAALGVPFEHVYVPGLVEREFPRSPAADPLLNDDERRALRQMLPHAHLSTRRERAGLERFLFAVACDSARSRLTLSWPRTDAQTGREQLPSAFVLEPARKLVDTVRDYASLDTFMRTHAHARRLPSTGSAQNSFPLNDAEFDHQRIHTATAATLAARVAELVAERPELKLALFIQHERFAANDFTVYDGLLRQAANGSLLQAATSATHLQTYATCPFQFFGLHVLRLAAYDEPDPLSTLSKQTRGLLLHHILEQFARTAMAEQDVPFRWPEWTRLEATARHAFHELRALFAGSSPFIRRYEQQQLLSILRVWLDAERARSDAAPLRLEEPFAVSVDGLALSGRIDRTDRLHAGTLRIIDYKTGKPKSRRLLLSLDSGRMLQLPLYMLALEQETAAVSSAEFLQLDENQARTIEISAAEFAALRPRLLKTLAVLQQEIAAGHCFPRPAATVCQYCQVRAACGSGRLTAKWDAESPLTAALRALEQSGETHA